MRHLDNVGVEWGTDWVIKHILQEELTSIDIDEALTQFKAYQEQLQQAATAPAVEQPTEEPAAEEPVTE